jgi:transposase
MARLSRIGIDTSKSVFQLHGVDEKDQAVLRKPLRRRQFVAFFAKLEPTLVGLEACGASHHWARELVKLGHQVVLIPPQYVKPYVGRNKNDRIDAEAVCEAMGRPKLQERFVPIKSIEQSAAQMLLGVRESLVKRRTQLTNTIRGHAAEFGLVAAKGLDKIQPLLARIAADDSLPVLTKEMFAVLGREYAELGPRIAQIDKKMLAFHRSNAVTRRLMEVPAIGPIGACLLVTKLVDPHAFRSGRRCAAWIGLTPKDHSTAGRQKLGGITRAGDERLRTVLVSGAMACIRHAKNRPANSSPWLVELLKRKPPKVAAVALANKTARIAWKLMTSGERYDPNRGAARQGYAA